VRPMRAAAALRAAVTAQPIRRAMASRAGSARTSAPDRTERSLGLTVMPMIDSATSRC
jgi:hypothetical protein